MTDHRRRSERKKHSNRGSSLASLNITKLLSADQTAFKQCRTHGAYVKNFAGHMKIQMGFFGRWKQCFFTLQGVELTMAEDEGYPALRSDTIAYVVILREKEDMLEFHMKSKKIWKTQCISRDIANAWFSAVDDSIGRVSYDLTRYFKSCDKRQIPTIMCGWLSEMDGKRVVARYFYVLRHLTLSVAPNIDITPEVYDVVTGLTAAAQDGAMKFMFESRPPLILRSDSPELLQIWHVVVRTCMNEPRRAIYG
ncbi:unnamed protein product [Aphanomyces euteiches]|uniref:PH domain-containing protein n=1 Tax=Aphanomyces euteiches TaxID=100861 RepID=A0A6G0XB68_9STRA|nr:hypothetical protein Ae201684_006552 [Aphanomyces euteiches]KAH9091102.1 hypothetical protein Ae201684P_006502 [Aphanomyces euteiches]KAH9157586.1 hypothetical protein AeRB84_000585 [Aphanomyces euteiches]